MPAMNVPRATPELTESTAVSNGDGSEQTTLHRPSLQNPTERPQNSPFFGSVFRSFLREDSPGLHRDAIRAGQAFTLASDKISLLRIGEDESRWRAYVSGCAEARAVVLTNRRISNSQRNVPGR